MSRTTSNQKTLKGFLAIINFLFGCLGLFAQDRDEAVIFRQVVDSWRRYDDTLFVSACNDNSDVIKMIAIIQESRIDRTRIDSLKRKWNLVSDEIFTWDFGNFEKQSTKSGWEITAYGNWRFTEDKANVHKGVISKPAFTDDRKHCLVKYFYLSESAILIFDKVGDGWVKSGILDASFQGTKAIFKKM